MDMAETDSLGSGSEPLRIFLWGVPRSASTVFTKFMTSVDGVSEVWFEPYVASYLEELEMSLDFDESLLHKFRTQFPEGNRGNLRLLQTFSYTSTKIELERQRKNFEGKYIFVKDMCWAIHGHYDKIPEKIPMRHVFLIRHPHRFLPSHFAHIKKVFRMHPDTLIDTEKDMLTGANEDQTLKLWRYVREKNIDPNPVVIDSDQFLENPDQVLPKLFAELGIPWKGYYLKWSEKEDFLLTWTAAVEMIFYGREIQSFSRAFVSKEFVRVDKPLPERGELPDESQKTVDIFMPGYKEMMEHALH